MENNMEFPKKKKKTTYASAISEYSSATIFIAAMITIVRM